MSSVESKVPPGFYTRGMLREKLQITEAELGYLERRNLVKVDHVNDYGWRLYSQATFEGIIQYRGEPSAPTSVKHHKAPAQPPPPPEPTYTEDQARDVFRKIRDGQALHLIVIETGVLPEVVVALSNRYAALSGAIFVSGDVVSAINKLPLDGETIETANDVLEKLTALASPRRCAACRRGMVCDMCVVCVRDKLVREKSVAILPKGEAPAPPVNVAPPNGSAPTMPVFEAGR
jgi:hypothetical protein